MGEQTKREADRLRVDLQGRRMTFVLDVGLLIVFSCLLGLSVLLNWPIWVSILLGVFVLFGIVNIFDDVGRCREARDRLRDAESQP